MAAYLIKRIIIALSLFLISPVYSVDCSHCDENDNLADAAVANSMGNGGIISELEKRLVENSGKKKMNYPLGKLRSEAHRELFCKA